MLLMVIALKYYDTISWESYVACNWLAPILHATISVGLCENSIQW